MEYPSKVIYAFEKNLTEENDMMCVQLERFWLTHLFMVVKFSRLPDCVV